MKLWDKGCGKSLEPDPTIIPSTSSACGFLRKVATFKLVGTLSIQADYWNLLRTSWVRCVLSFRDEKEGEPLISDERK